VRTPAPYQAPECWSRVSRIAGHQRATERYVRTTTPTSRADDKATTPARAPRENPPPDAGTRVRLTLEDRAFPAGAQ
jgi:hypothetical protein